MQVPDLEFSSFRFLSIKEFLGEEDDYVRKQAERAFDIIDK